VGGGSQQGRTWEEKGIRRKEVWDEDMEKKIRADHSAHQGNAQRKPVARVRVRGDKPYPVKTSRGSNHCMGCITPSKRDEEARKKGRWRSRDGAGTGGRGIR